MYSFGFILYVLWCHLLYFWWCAVEFFMVRGPTWWSQVFVEGLRCRFWSFQWFVVPVSMVLGVV